MEQLELMLCGVFAACAGWAAQVEALKSPDGRNAKLNGREQYTRIADAIRATGRTDVMYNVCRWSYPGAWITGVAQTKPARFNEFKGDTGLTPTEEIAHFGMWCITSSRACTRCASSTTRRSRRTATVSR